MTEKHTSVPERMRARLDAERTLLAEHLRAWLDAHRATPHEIDAALDPDGANYISVWLITDHTGREDSSSRVAYEPIADAFGIVIDMQNGISWFQGADVSLGAAIENI